MGRSVGIAKQTNKTKEIMSKITQSEKDQLILSNDSSIISSLGGGGGATAENLNKSYEGLVCSDFQRIELNTGKTLLLTVFTGKIEGKLRNVTSLSSIEDKIGMKVTLTGGSYQKKDAEGNRTEVLSYSFNVSYREAIASPVVTAATVVAAVQKKKKAA